MKKTTKILGVLLIAIVILSGYLYLALYYPESTGDNVPNQSILKKFANDYYENNIPSENPNEDDISYDYVQITNNTFFITILRHNIKDDSIASESYRLRVMIDENNNIDLVSVEKEWRCQQGRGHTYFSDDLCL